MGRKKNRRDRLRSCMRPGCRGSWSWRITLELATGDGLTQDLCNLHLVQMVNSLPEDGSLVAASWISKTDLDQLAAVGKYPL